jgi:type I restriction enzyme S subunit
MSFPRYPKYKASGVEWLGDVPEHWETIPLRRTAVESESLFIDGDWIESNDLSDNGIRYLTSGNVGEGYYKEQGQGYISEETFAALKCIEVLPGDVLISRLNLPIGRSCLVPKLGGRIVTCVDNVIMRLDSNFHRRFFVYQLTSKSHFANMENLAKGTTMQRISRSTLGRVRFAIPPLPEQLAITAFLDRETAKIDELVNAQARLIELLKEKRQAVISHAVTKGLNPHAPMKPSGVKWLGDVPAHWEVLRMGAVFRAVVQPGTAALPILSVSIHDGVSDKEIADEEMDRKVTRSDDRSKYLRVAPGDLVYNMMRAWQGGFGTVTVEGMVSPAYVVARPIRDIQTGYVERLLRTRPAVEQMRRQSRGVTDFRLRLYWDEFKNIRVPVPPSTEVSAILSCILKMEKAFDDIECAALESITLLRERRSALISAAVTGQIDIRNTIPMEAA